MPDFTKLTMVVVSFCALTVCLVKATVPTVKGVRVLTIRKIVDFVSLLVLLAVFGWVAAGLGGVALVLLAAAVFADVEGLVPARTRGVHERGEDRSV